MSGKEKLKKIQRLIDRNQLFEALKICLKVCKTSGADGVAFTKLALIHRKIGNLPEAVGAIERAIKISPGNAETLKIYGTIKQMLGDTAGAVVWYKKSLAIESRDAEVHFLLGNSLRELSSLVESDCAYRAALDIDPNYLAALCNRGALLVLLNYYEEARVLLSRAETLSPGIPQVQCNIAMLDLAEDKIDSAEECCIRLLDANPNFIDALVLYADLKEKSGRNDEAWELVRKGLALDKNNIPLNLTAARLDRQSNRLTEAIERLERLREKQPEVMQQDLLMQLGELYDKAGNADKAYQCLSDGNRLKRETRISKNAESQDFEIYVEQRRSKFIKEASVAWSEPPSEEFSDDPIFVFGFPRSGTTLLEQILDAHTELQALPEKPAVAEVNRVLAGRNLNNLNPADIHELRNVYFSEVEKHIQRDPGKVLVDKNPLNTIEIPLIFRLFPRARYVLAVRHPCDVILSCFMQKIVFDADKSAFYSLKGAATAYAGVMSLWKDYISRLPINYHRLRYEDLVSNPREEAEKLVEYLGIPWEENLLRQDEHAKTHHINTPSYHQVTRPIYRDAMYRWKHYEKYMDEAKEILMPYIEYFDYLNN